MPEGLTTPGPEYWGDPAKLIGLPSGDALDPSEAYRFARSGPAPLVLLAGPVRSGKTTLIASVHDRFLAGPFCDYWIAGSETFRAFEQRCFDSRLVSGNVSPKTGRTLPAEGPSLYHTRLRRGGPQGAVRNLLLMDMSGEFFKEVSDSRQQLMELGIARQSDHFVLLVSGPMLFSPDVQAKIYANAATLIRRCTEGGVLGSDSRVDVLLTKWDVVSTLFPSSADSVLARFSERLKNSYGGHFRRMRITPIAARPHPGSPLPTLWGLEELFRSWVEELPIELDRQPLPAPWPSDASDMFDLFALKQAPELFASTL
jgi:hypothetical protein